MARCAFPARGEPVDCAVSGGADSLALPVLASEAGCAVTAHHVDHGIRDGTAGEAALVERAAALVGAGFVLHRASVEPGPNLEARARAARKQLLPRDVATGHTMDDQAETVLINLLRGAGTDGLAGMRFGRTHPLLRLRRAETLLVCRAARLAPVMDPTNDDPAMVRNRVRHDLIPRCNEIAARDVVPVLARQTGLLAEESEVLEQLASTVDPTSTAALAAAPAALARRAVRAWLRDGTVYPPSSASVERVLAVARGSPRACEVEGGRRVRRSRGRLFLEPSRPPAGAGAAATVATGDEDL